MEKKNPRSCWRQRNWTCDVRETVTGIHSSSFALCSDYLHSLNCNLDSTYPLSPSHSKNRHDNGIENLREPDHAPKPETCEYDGHTNQELNYHLDQHSPPRRRGNCQHPGLLSKLSD